MNVRDLKKILEKMDDDDLVCVIDDKTLYPATLVNYDALRNRIIFVRSTNKEINSEQ